MADTAPLPFGWQLYAIAVSTALTGAPDDAAAARRFLSLYTPDFDAIQHRRNTRMMPKPIAGLGALIREVLDERLS